jgi:hypothetical protein
MNLKNTNIELKEGAYFLEYCPSGDSFGNRILILTYNIKETLKKYKKANYYLFASPLLFSENLFFLLNNSMKIRTKNGKKIAIGNALYHINEHINNGTLQTEI